ncbi:MAG: hypothetical protein HQL47_08425 [Gammaproteobacteria bacterium]|nr:hypothetical protein [Gammaproteobacteria bacterium]
MRVVLDTNILLAALMTRGTPPDQLATGDRNHLLALAQHGATRIISARDLVEVLR